MQDNRRNALRKIGAAFAAGSAGGLLTPAARAQTPAKFPSSPLRFIVPVGPGSGADSSTRFIAERMGKLLGQPAIVENKPGGDYVIGVQALLNAPPDGHTLMMISQTSMVVNAIINKGFAYEPLRDIRPLVASAGGSPVLVTSAGSKYHSVADVVAAVRKEPRSVTMAYYGHFYRVCGLMMEEIGKLQFSHIPYKGASQAITDLVGGSVDLSFVDAGAALPMLRSGRLRALAVSSKSRHPDLPDLPTLDQSGFPGYDMFIWIGYGISSKVPDAQAQVLQSALMKVISQPDFAAFSTQNGNFSVLNMPGKELAVRIAAETERFRGLLQAAEPNR
jgi:tripartite-type tricarboxylate transporter receptor subunit TctC